LNIEINESFQKPSPDSPQAESDEDQPMQMPDITKTQYPKRHLNDSGLDITKQDSQRLKLSELASEIVKADLQELKSLRAPSP
jgi:hypothetical protein